ncbi:MAG: gamma-glutamyltransferase, partial [Candidatus Limnocylindria bacterium]
MTELARGVRGMVATPHPLATLAGIDALRAGGNAVDAAVAANAILAVVYNHACGLGGDAFALVWSPDEQRLHAYNGSGRAPAALTAGLVRERGHDAMPVRGALSVTVPGAVDAWSALVTRFGRRTLADALLPAAEIADGGHAVSGRSAAAIAASETLLHGDDGAAETFLPDGRPPRPGSLLPQPMLARTLRLLALEGRDAFYRGPIARDIVAAMGAAGGVMSADDLASHAGEWTEPVRTAYREVEACTTPPNSQGLTALIALKVVAALRERGWPDHPADVAVSAGSTAPAAL